MSESWVINASPVILLAKAGLLERVASLAETLVIPKPVMAEISSVHSDVAALWLRESGQRFICPAVTELNELSGAEIGAGERAVISWAATHRGFIAVLDDREARSIAQLLGVRILGTVGVVLRLKRAGLVSDVKPHLVQIKQVGGYISDGLFREALKSAGEQP